jgi:hypothetical protein
LRLEAEVPGAAERRQFRLILIKPSRYDDEGYVIQWKRSAILSNTLAALNGLAMDCRDRRVLGPDLDLLITAYDETNTHIPGADRAGDQRREHGARCTDRRTVQPVSPRPRHRPATARGRRGGVSGCLAMLPEMPSDLNKRWTSASACLPARPRAASRPYCVMRAPER